MKKTFFALLFISLGASVYCQSITIGPKVGVSLSNISVSNSSASVSFNTKTSLDAGAFVEIGLGDNFSIQPEIYYSGQGFSVVGGNQTLSYIEIPVLAKYNFNVPVVRPFVEVGPFVGILAAASSNSDGQGSTDNKDAFKSTNVGIQFGGGASVKAGPGKFILDLRYGLGLTNIESGSDGSETAKSNAFHISLGYGFTLGK